MRRKDPLIIGAGPAGCAAAITLAVAGQRPLLLERARETGDALCGGFVSWQTLARLNALGVSLPGHVIGRVRLYAGDVMSEAALPAPGLGLSRRAMDSALLKAARAAGAGLERGVTVRDLAEVRHPDRPVFLATGKHDLKGAARPRTATDPALGLRVRVPVSPALAARIGDAIELHLFDRGYAGVELQEDGTANICLALRKSRLAEAGRDPARLLAELGAASVPFGDRLAGMSAATPIEAIANVPYGWRQTDDPDGVFRLGDQAAVIPSLAGEGNGIALASGVSAARALLDGAAPADWQRDFARQTRRPVGLAKLVWQMGERPGLARLATGLLGSAPGLVAALARATRVTDRA
ncbi:MAG: NAD(P)/FAD-dependent oxidoreductase [Chakrabartia sp.]